jgi:hypothetical protein
VRSVGIPNRRRVGSGLAVHTRLSICGSDLTQQVDTSGNPSVLHS